MKRLAVVLLSILLSAPSAWAYNGMVHSASGGITSGSSDDELEDFSCVDSCPTCAGAAHSLTTGDIAIVTDPTTRVMSVYVYDATSSASASSPYIIVPSDSVANCSNTGRWLLSPLATGINTSAQTGIDLKLISDEDSGYYYGHLVTADVTGDLTSNSSIYGIAFTTGASPSGNNQDTNGIYSSIYQGGTNNIGGAAFKASVKTEEGDAVANTVYAFDGLLGGADTSDIVYGLSVNDVSIAGGTGYGLYLDIDDGWGTGWNVYVADGGSNSYFGTATQMSSIELGHATANTLTASGGVLSVEGTAVSMSGHTHTVTDTKCIYIESPTTGDDLTTIWVTNVAATITGISCESDDTVTMDLQIDDGTPAAVNGSAISCTSTWAEDTTLAGDTSMGADERLDLDMATVGSATWVSICWEYTTTQ